MADAPSLWEPIDLFPRRHEEAVRRLVSLAIGYPTPERVSSRLESYGQPGWRLRGFEVEGRLVAYIGYQASGTEGVVHGIAVVPDARGRGYGRAMLRWLVETQGFKRVGAETDEEAVGFYRKCGFTVGAFVDERWPETRRYKCVLRPEAS